ncbi:MULTISPECIES: ABC transporter ATP-binding protein [unclassified Clostridium]|uniref:ABC transporter ATP-binding protein n=1 Tax=unclassified Clostridium TaxID=2614128 RepID=UPI000297EC9A|nr:MULTISPECIES: ABC transporter ATP-binding protein [unclassified Clostridium]EKQ50195.1 MAG: oligopeptide/dipeptide ABC transporter, ATP-binding protein [Clostridium sp. Maddingley MBC34-26]
MNSQDLIVNNLSISFTTDNGKVIALDDVSFVLEKGKILGVIGESGCGKSTLALSIMKLLPEQISKIEHGEILFNGDDLMRFSEDRLENLRGNEISMIFQEPMTSLNPLFKIGRQIEEPLKIHKHLHGSELRNKVIELLKIVHIPNPEKIYDSYPHSLSGGMRQRVMIAMALSCEPQILIADEPTTALDVTIQAQILHLLKKLNEKVNTSMLFITHDLSVIAEICDEVMVLYGGKVVEQSDIYELFDNPKHPYTIGLLESQPHNMESGKELPSIQGMVPALTHMPLGCRFSTRCSTKFCEKCVNKQPLLFNVNRNHKVACWLYEEGMGIE